MDMSEEKFDRRSQYWFGLKDKGGYIHRERLRNQGYAPDVFDGRPVIGIANTWSELNPCNGSLNDIAEAVKRGVWEAGGFPLEFPAMSLSESLQRPTTMLYRNMLAMEVEELIRSHPLDGVVLLGNCDKTPPGLLMGAASVDLPALMITGGPMLNGRYHGEAVGSGTLVWKYSEQVRSGKISFEEFMAMESCSARSQGSCMTMGTASTMACVTEALGVQLPGAAAIPAVDSRKFTLAHLSGRRIVKMVEEDLRLSKILNRKAFENAIKILAAIGGSTNAVVHLLAIAGRVGVPLSLDDFDKLGKDVPVIANMMPSGKFLMEEFFDAGGVPTVMKEISNLIHTDHITVTGKTVKENIEGAENWNKEVITPANKPFQAAGGGIGVVRGSLAPDGAIIKVSAASPKLLTHKGKALVFNEIEDAVLSGKVDAGVIIHENRFTYKAKGLKKIIDLGEYWENETGLPIPLGGIGIKRGLSQEIKKKVDRLIKKSIQFAFHHPTLSLPYITLNAQEMDEEIVRKHIHLYVNEYSENIGEKGKEAVIYLFNKINNQATKLDIWV